MFSCEFCFFYRTPPVAASESRRILEQQCVTMEHNYLLIHSELLKKMNFWIYSIFLTKYYNECHVFHVELSLYFHDATSRFVYMFTGYPLEIRPKLNFHKAFIGSSLRYTNVLFTFNSGCVSTEIKRF